jgi:phosphatidate cytidylyltransferase
MKTRVVVGLLMAVALVAIYLLDTMVFERALASRLLLWLLALGALHEVLALASRKVERNPGLFFYSAIAVVAVVVPHLVMGRPLPAALIAVAAVGGAGIRLLGMAPLRSAAAAFPEALLVAVAILYTAGLIAFLDLLLLQSVATGFAVVVVSKSADIGGYLIGTYLGRKRIAPAVSPKKTWEGTIAGLLFAVGAGALLARELAGPPAFAAAIGGLLGLASVLGDFVGSGLKRWAGVKDSSVLLPEYGGFIDLLDGILLAGPVAVICLHGS